MVQRFVLNEMGKPDTILPFRSTVQVFHFLA